MVDRIMVHDQARWRSYYESLSSKKENYYKLIQCLQGFFCARLPSGS